MSAVGYRRWSLDWGTALELRRKRLARLGNAGVYAQGQRCKP